MISVSAIKNPNPNIQVKSRTKVVLCRTSINVLQSASVPSAPMFEGTDVAYSMRIKFVATKFIAFRVYPSEKICFC